jgi:hypothetical protein
VAASYKKAIKWIAANDDNEWLRNETPFVSVTASLVMDLYDKSENELLRDLVAELRHIHPNSWFGKLPWEEA